jgi:hypothetical protein
MPIWRQGLVDSSGTVRWENFTEAVPHPRQSRRDAGSGEGDEVKGWVPRFADLATPIRFCFNTYVMLA